MCPRCLLYTSCTGYLGDIGVPPPYGPMDFAGWFEAYLGGRWYTFDPRNNIPRIGRVLIAQGRDATDVPITHTFGPSTLASFKVWTDCLLYTSRVVIWLPAGREGLRALRASQYGLVHPLPASEFWRTRSTNERGVTAYVSPGLNCRPLLSRPSAIDVSNANFHANEVSKLGIR